MLRIGDFSKLARVSVRLRRPAAHVRPGPSARAEYEVLTSQGTLEDFRQVQLVDAGIIAGTALLFPALALLATRRHSSGSRWRQAGFIATAALVAAPAMDALET